MNEPTTQAGRVLDGYAGPAYRHIIVNAENEARAEERERAEEDFWNQLPLLFHIARCHLRSKSGRGIGFQALLDADGRDQRETDRG